MLDTQLRLAHLDAALIEQLGNFQLLGGEFLGALVLQRTHRNDRQARIKLHAGHRLAGAGAEEGLLEGGVGNRFAGAGKACTQLNAGRAHLQIGGDHLAPANAAGHEHHRLVAQRGQNFLHQHAGGNRADVAARL